MSDTPVGSKASAGTGISVERTPDNRLRVNVPSDFSFDVGRADIKPRMRPVLDEMARNLDGSVRVSIVGRGVGPARIDVQGRGERESAASNGSDSGRAANRRVEVFLVEHAG